MDPGFGSTGRQEDLSAACHHHPLWWSVIGFAANSMHERELHSSSQPVSGYSCPLDELCNGSAILAFRTAKYLYFAAWIYADVASVRPSSSPPPRRFLIRFRPLFSAQASSHPSVILHSRAILTSKTLSCFRKNTQSLKLHRQPAWSLWSGGNTSTNSAVRAEPVATGKTASDTVLTAELLHNWTVGTETCHRKHDLSFLTTFFFFK